MEQMTDALKLVAGDRMKNLLARVTTNRFKAVLAGTVVTATIQSSSVTTVLVVGFISAGLMTLSQSIGVIMGAEIGTTITAQIIAFKLDALAYPAIALGLLLVIAGKKPWMNALGEAILGFGLLFLGMTTMSHILKPLRHSPSFQAM